MGVDSENVLEVLWNQAREIFLRSLKSRDAKKEEPRDDTATLENTIKSLRQAQDKAAVAYGAKFVGKPIEFKLGRVLQRLEVLVQMGDQAMQFAPETASYVWSAFRILFAGFLKDFETCQLLADQIDAMSDIVFICDVYAKRQVKRVAAITNQVEIIADKILQKIPELLSLVLMFAYHARKLVLDHTRLGRTLRVVFGSSQELEATCNDAKTKRDELHAVAEIAFQEAAMEILLEYQQDSKVIAKLFQATEAMQSEQKRQKDDIDRKELDNDFNEQMRWLRSGTSADIGLPRKVLNENLARRHPGTCTWIQKHAVLTQWLENTEPTTTSHLVWVAGEAGFGKSVLMSSIVEWLESQQSGQEKDRPIILHFFCKTGDPATERGDKVMLHLLMQLLSHAATEPPKKAKSSEDKTFQARKQKCVDLVKEDKASLSKPDQESFSSSIRGFQAKSNMQPLMVNLAKALERKVFIVVDALDECNDWSGGFLEALRMTAGAHTNIKVLVSSRPDHAIRDALQGYAFIDVAKDSTASDVSAYISWSMQKIRRFNKKQRKVASEKIMENADGMFRYANLAVESLQSPKAVTMGFQKIMAEFPEGMAGLYTQELQRLSAEVRPIVLTALRWKICGKGIISAVPIADELEKTYENVDDSTDESEADDESEEGRDDDIHEDQASDEFSKNPEEKNGEASMYDETIHSGNSGDTEDGVDRDSIDILKRYSRAFLKFDKANCISLQHASVREFIIREGGKPPHQETLCQMCRERSQSTSTYEATPEQGHLAMAIHCLKHLNCRSFQKQFLPKDILEKHLKDQEAKEAEPRAAINGETTEAGGTPSETSVPIFAATDFKKEQEGHLRPRSPRDIDVHNVIEGLGSELRKDSEVGDSQEAPGQENEMPSVLTADPLEDEGKCNHDEGGPDGNDDNDSIRPPPTDAVSLAYIGEVNDVNVEGEDLRYELTHWHYHVREAKKWRNGGSDDEQWKDLSNEINKFLSEDSDVFKVWQKRVLHWRIFKTFDRPIHVAARFGLLGYVRQYVESGGDIDVENEDKCTPLSLACLGEGDYVGLEYLVEHNADLKHPDNYQDTPLHLLVDYNGPANKLKYLLSKAPDVPAMHEKFGQTLLHLAILQRGWESLKVILEYPAADVNAKDINGETPLHFLLKWPNTPNDILELLLSKGANVNAQDNDSQAPLYEACLSENVEAARILLEAGADVNDGEIVFGRTALHEAIENQNLPLVNLLLEFNADVTLKDKQLRDAASLAAYKGNADISKAVLDKLNVQTGDYHTLADPDIHGHTPLQKSAARGIKEIAELLLKAGDGSKLVAQCSRRGKTALHSAAVRGHLDVVKLLVEHGADILARDCNGNFPMQLAVAQWRRSGLLNSASFRETVTYLGNKMPTQAEAFGPELCDVAIESGAVDICRMLVSVNGSIISKEDQHGWTPLMLAIQARQHDIIQLLVPFDTNQPLHRFSRQEILLGHKPSAWSTDDSNKFKNMTVSEDGLGLTSTLHLVNWERGFCRANHPVPFGMTRYYYEIAVTQAAFTDSVALGFTNRYTPVDNLPGWQDYGGPNWGYHGGDGGLFEYSSNNDYPQSIGPKWGMGDIVGCGIDFSRCTIFYTKNGELLGEGFRDVKSSRVFPCVGLYAEGPTIRANFGLDDAMPFKYDLGRFEEDCKMPNQGPVPGEHATRTFPRSFRASHQAFVMIRRKGGLRLSPSGEEGVDRPDRRLKVAEWRRPVGPRTRL
ncbi:hypothetical protein DL764_001867 [Monosporascus ibericus]|uniref:B30.2/SPRY domain-containing protein n=1 Tax=Monosporascus ibericus TaxID=155417 RepID=A0A4Q4TMV4_9PEZI|nr:hypothetical protein DL764_001867 [Monosporascus ibericus]